MVFHETARRRENVRRPARHPERRSLMNRRPDSSGILSIGTGIALGAGLGLIVGLVTDLGIAMGLIVGAAAGLIAILISNSMRRTR
jgi:hypothetical protein